MLTIRGEQMAALARYSTAQFEQRLVAHLRQEFPERCAPLDDEALLGFVRHGIQRAAVYGITAQRDVCLYVDLMILHGRDVDQDPGRPEVARILRSETMEPRQRLERLHADLGALGTVEEGRPTAGGR